MTTFDSSYRGTMARYIVEIKAETKKASMPIGRYETGHLRVETDYLYAEPTADNLQKVIDDYNRSNYYAVVSELRSPFQFILDDKRGIVITKTESAALVILSDGTLGEIRPLDEKRNIYRNSAFTPLSASEAECGYGASIASVFETVLGKINTQISMEHKDAWPELYVGGSHVGLSKAQHRQVLREQDAEYAAYCAQRYGA